MMTRTKHGSPIPNPAPSPIVVFIGRLGEAPPPGSLAVLGFELELVAELEATMNVVSVLVGEEFGVKLNVVNVLVCVGREPATVAGKEPVTVAGKEPVTVAGGESVRVEV